MNNAWAKEIKTITMSGATQVFTIQTNVLPVYTGINVDSKISDAISSEYKTIKTVGTNNYSLGKVNLIISNKGVDSSFIRIEHNLAKADAIKNNVNQFRLNTQHYWKVDGIIASGFASKMRFNYDGNKNTTGISYLDTCLTTNNGDSIMLLYRKNAADDWKEVFSYTKFNAGPKSGFFTTDSFKLGEYVFANGKSSVLIGLNERSKPKIDMIVFPNPTSQLLTIYISNFKMSSSFYIDIVDLQGKLVKQITHISNENNITVSDLAKGEYVINLNEKTKTVVSNKIIVE